MWEWRSTRHDAIFGNAATNRGPFRIGPFATGDFFQVPEFQNRHPTPSIVIVARSTGIRDSAHATGTLIDQGDQQSNAAKLPFAL